MVVALPGLFSDMCTNEMLDAIQSDLNSSNTDGSFTMPNSNSFLSPYGILPIAQENKCLRGFSYFILKLDVRSTYNYCVENRKKSLSYRYLLADLAP